MRIDKETREKIEKKVQEYGITSVAKGSGLAYNTIYSITKTGVCTSTSFTKLVTYLNAQKNKYEKLINALED